MFWATSSSSFALSSAVTAGVGAGTGTGARARAGEEGGLAGCVLVFLLVCCLLLTTLSTTLHASIFDVVEWKFLGTLGAFTSAFVPALCIGTTCFHESASAVPGSKREGGLCLAVFTPQCASVREREANVLVAEASHGSGEESRGRSPC